MQFLCRPGNPVALRSSCSSQVRIPRIPPGTNNTHVLVVRPRKFGYFNFTAAEVSYRPSDDLEQVHVGFSSDPGQGLIISLRDYDKQFSAHMVSNATSEVVASYPIARPTMPK